MKQIDDAGLAYLKHFPGTSYKLFWEIRQQNTDLKHQTW